MRKICVLASGGDCPGLNACIEAIYLSSIANGMEVWAAINGFDGLVTGEIVKACRDSATGISNRSGCVFGCNRGIKYRTHEGFKSAIANIKKHGFECIVVLGGNGSLVGTGRLRTAGINAVYIPSTVDNDVPGYKKSLGFGSACESAVKMVDMLRATMETSERDHIVQLMGRNCNELAVRVGTATFADLIDMEGARISPEQVASVFKANRAAGKKSNFMILQEFKADDAVQEKLVSAEYLKRIMQAMGTNDIRLNVLGHLQRGADPSCFDRYLAVRYGKAAVECVLHKKYGFGLDLVKDTITFHEIEFSPIP